MPRFYNLFRACRSPSRRWRRILVWFMAILFLYMYLRPAEEDGIISDPRDGPLPSGVCSYTEPGNDTGLPERTKEPIEPGGHFKPHGCRARERVAIIVPYRERQLHLKLFLAHMHDFLQTQKLEYVIYIVEPALPTTFNRGILVNIGFQYAIQSGYNITCVVIHDVDLLPVDYRNLYVCSDNPRHMSSANSKFFYRLPYPRYAGGVISFTPEQFKFINGFSNVYFGWGGEDDDLRLRIARAGYSLHRVPFNIGIYQALGHDRDNHNKDNSDRLELLYHADERLKTDGLNSLNFKVLSVEKRPLYTWIYVQVNQSDYNTKPVLSFITKLIFTLRPCIFNYFFC